MLDVFRRQIDDCDKVLIETLARRFGISAQIAAYKQEQGIAVYQPERERAILDDMAKKLSEQSCKNEILELYRHIFRLGRRSQFAASFPYNIVLVGFMGSGKSTVGALLAERVGYTFCDIDKWIEEETGRTIERIFHILGEEAFRILEREMIERLKTSTRTIISCGGGAVMDPANVAALKQQGRLIWLQAQLPTIADRLSGTGDRPLWNSKSGAAVTALFEQRQPIYRAAADCTVTTDDCDADEVADRILQKLMLYSDQNEA